MSPTVIPRSCADEDAVYEPARAIVAIRSAGIRIIGVITIGANWSSADADANGTNSDSDNNSGVRKSHWHREHRE
jgi:hypothetical protein